MKKEQILNFDHSLKSIELCFDQRPKCQKKTKSTYTIF